MGTNRKPENVELEQVVCEAVEAPRLPGEAVIIPAGQLTRFDGSTLVVDPPGADQIIQHFNSRGIDLVIDREHQSEGGEFSSPDGTAPAAGWVKQGSMRFVPDKGLVAHVDWTPWASRVIANKEYRYLSPVTSVEKKSRRVVAINSIGLTNRPAINRFPAVVNSAVVAQTTERNESMDELLKYLRAELGLGEEATAEEVLAALKEKMGSASEAVANKAKLKLVSDELGVSLEGEVETVANSVRTVFAGLKKKASGTGVPADQVAKMAEEIETLKKGRVDDAFQTLLNKHPGKIAPADETWFRPIFDADAKQAETIINGMPKKVHTEPGKPGGGGPAGGGDRITIINSARSQFKEGGNWGDRSEREFVDGLLLASSQKRLTDDEAGKLAIVG